jgi:2-methylcitrate dehydratase PrpD
MKASRTEISPVMQELSAYIIRARSGNRCRHRYGTCPRKLHVLDTIAAMVSGRRLRPGEIAARYVESLGGKPVATVIATGIMTSPVNAALANAMAAHADETDDTHPPSRTHPGSGVVPAALAICERDRLSGRAVLRAIVLGYDICARTLLAINEMHFRHTGHHPSTFGRGFGAAAAAAALLGFDARKVRFVLSYTAQQAAGLSTVYRDSEHIEKAFSQACRRTMVSWRLMVAHDSRGGRRLHG